jgi:hypothetical protein
MGGTSGGKDRLYSGICGKFHDGRGGWQIIGHATVVVFRWPSARWTSAAWALHAATRQQQEGMDMAAGAITDRASTSSNEWALGLVGVP